MPILTRPSAAPGMSLSYITIGSLLAIWSAVWYAVAPPQTQWTRIVCLGLFLTGLAFLLIGFGVGYIGRAARTAELPPGEVTPAIARESQVAAARGAGGQAGPQAAQPPPVPGNTVVHS